MFLQFLMVFCLAGACLSQCPTSWVQHQDGCYHYRTDQETWIDAREVCIYLGGALAEINNVDENTFLTGHVANGSSHEAWIGGNDLNIEGVFVWEHSGLNMNTTGYANWHSGEPNISSSDLKEDCVELKRDGTWNDENCSDKQQYICEKELESGVIVG